MQVQPEFPEHQLNDPRRQAERRVYEELASSDVPGQALYQVRASRTDPEVDFMVWEEGIGTFGLEVKGGRYQVANGDLDLMTSEGPQPAPGLLSKTMNATLAIRNVLACAVDPDAYAIPVLLFPDMEPDPEIIRWGQRHRTHVMFGHRDLANRLGQLNAVSDVRRPPTAERIEREIAVLTGEPAPETEPEQLPGEARAAPQTRPVVVRHLVINNYYVAQAAPLP